MCDACGEEEETKEHVFDSEKLREEGRSWQKIDYENIKYGSLEEKTGASKLLNENLRKLQILRKYILSSLNVIHFTNFYDLYIQT